MYREQGWFDALEFAYDMSVPNTAHLEPQRGGCCTVMPYFVGDILELPLTTVQDYSLFHILNDYSTSSVAQQMALIFEKHGLISMITHPDYLIGEPEHEVYRGAAEASRGSAGPRRAVDRPARRGERVVAQSSSACRSSLKETAWRVEGPGSERARVAYARLEGNRVVYSQGRP